jgi:gliding motility-associated-like protein
MMGCDSLLTLILSVIDPVDLSIADEFYCNSPEHYALSASYHDGWRYHWTSLPPDASMGSQANYGSIVVNPRQTTTYYVQASYGASGWCPQLDSISLNPIVPLHVVWDVKPDYLTEDNLLVTASNLSSGYTSQSWFVDGNRMDEPGSQFTYECGRETDSIILMLVINNEMCTDTATKTIRMQTASIYFPNVFTPGMDNNNRFAPIYTGIVDYEIWIYDRQGMLVYYSTEPQPGWDGTHNGSPCRQATYVYHCRYRNQLMPKGYLTATGTVTLLR